MKRGAADLQLDAVRWFARLPFLGADELSLLLATTKPNATHLLRELEDVGWAEWITPSSPELDRERLYVLSDGSIAKLAETLCVREHELQQSLAVSRREVLERLLRLETAVGLNRFAAQLVAAVRDDEEVELAEFRSLPWRRRRAQTWWPPEVEAYGCLRWGSWRAPFFVAWDRAGAPAFHRRRRVSAWYAFREGQDCWGRDDMPPILIVCPGESEAREWARAVLAAADRRKVSPLSSFLTDMKSALAVGPLDSIWHRPDGTTPAYLCERLPWRPAFSQERTGLPEANTGQRLESLTETAKPLREWAREATLKLKVQQENGVERLAAVSIATSAMGKQVLEWLGHHPLLSAQDMSVVLRVSGHLAQRLLGDLVERGLVGSTDERLKGETIAARRYFLSALGLKLLAARDGVPARRYLRHGIVAASMPGKTGGTRLETLIRQLDHTVGANQFFVRLIAEAGNGKARLVRWLSPSEAALKFTFAETMHWLRPDGAGDIDYKGKLMRFYLEWDRGTIGWPDMTEKLRGYVSYFAANGKSKTIAPRLLIVTTSHVRENVMWRILDDSLSDLRAKAENILTTVGSLIDKADPFGNIWRSSSTSQRSAYLEH